MSDSSSDILTGGLSSGDPESILTGGLNGDSSTDTPLTILDLVKLEVAGVGDLSLITDASIPTLVELYWTLYADKATISANLQRLYTRRDAFLYLMSSAKRAIDFSVGPDKTSYNQLFTNISKLYDETATDIAQTEAEIVIGTAGVSRLGSVRPISSGRDSREKERRRLLRGTRFGR